MTSNYKSESGLSNIDLTVRAGESSASLAWSEADKPCSPKLWRDCSNRIAAQSGGPMDRSPMFRKIAIATRWLCH